MNTLWRRLQFSKENHNYRAIHKHFIHIFRNGLMASLYEFLFGCPNQETTGANCPSHFGKMLSALMCTHR
jgi:hypothetical protein